MLKRKQYSEEFKRKIGLELETGISTAAEISKRQGVSSTTLYKWQRNALDLGASIIQMPMCGIVQINTLAD